MLCNSSIIAIVFCYDAETAMSHSKSTIHGAKARQGHTAVRRCKVVATIGPSSSDEATLRTMIEAGLDIVRLNFSHGDHATHLASIEMIRRLTNECGRNVTIMQDLQGPKIRCGLLTQDMHLQDGESYTLAYGERQTDTRVIPVAYDSIFADLQVGQKILMNDGLLAFEITAVSEVQIEVKVIDGGVLKSRKGISFPRANLSLSVLTEKDTEDLLFGIGHGVDAIALSFVQNANDVVQVKKMIAALSSNVPVIAKIERLAALNDIAAIAATSDGLMVARGDLGVEVRIEKVPACQRKIIAAAAANGKPVIIATQMLESMIENPLASLAEVADVANGVLESADCVMLSAETASGKYPVQTLRKMIAIIDAVEHWTLTHRDVFTTPQRQAYKEQSTAWEMHTAIAATACEAADSLNAKAIVCLTLSGSIAASIARWRPKTPVIAISPRQEVIRRLNLIWGVYGIQNPLFYKTDVLLQELPQRLKDMGIVQSGDTIVITAGIPIAQMCPTNMIKINKIA